MSTKKLFFLILLLGFLFRLFLLPQTFNTDLIQQAEWGQKTFQQGTTNFYSDSTWIFSSPNHPPIAILLYKTDYYLYRQFSLHLHQINFFLQKRNLISPNNSFCQFVNSFDQIVSPEKPFRLGYLLTLKLIPILSDILIAFIIFKVAQKKSSHPLIYPTLFLFMPFSWYISSLWGQTDQLSFLFLILAFISLPKKPTLSIILFYLSIAIKPTGITLLPLFLFLLWKNKTNLLSFLTGVYLSIIITFLSFKPFYSQDISNFIFHILIPHLTDRPPRLTTNIYNFWHIFTLNNSISSNIKILFLSATTWSLLFFATINLLVFSKIKKVNAKSIFLSLFIISFCSYFFLTNMLDRYAFTAIVSGIFVLIYYPKIIYYWLTLAFVFSLNIYRLWWYPQSIDFLKKILTFDNYIIGIPLSLLSLFCFIQILKKIRH